MLKHSYDTKYSFLSWRYIKEFLLYLHDLRKDDPMGCKACLCQSVYYVKHVEAHFTDKGH